VPKSAVPVANGLRTDHPIPDLPFVDDSHLPLEDPRELEAIGRRHGTDMWGREDRCGEGWVAFTTEPARHELAWLVRHDPEHGRSVVLYRDDDAAAEHEMFSTWCPALLFRAGGYWWDGTTWYRPLQIWDPAAERYVHREVPGALAVSAADLLRDSGADPDRGQLLQIGDVDLDAGAVGGRWLDDLALWASRREDRQQDGRPPLSRCVVRISAPELTGDQLVGLGEMADIADVAASTLRAYSARGEADIPQPQATVNGRNVWSRAVAQEFAERRRQSPDGVAEPVSTSRVGSTAVPVGIGELWRRYTRIFTSALWENPARRRRWALRWRTQAAVQNVAEDLAWYVAADVAEGTGGIIPTADLAATIQHAVLDELATGWKGDHRDEDWFFCGIQHNIARMLDWLIRHHPATAAHTIAHIVGTAEDRLKIPRKVTENSLRTALSLDSKLDASSRQEFLDRALGGINAGGQQAVAGHLYVVPKEPDR
jgi:hypothetical protein